MIYRKHHFYQIFNGKHRKDYFPLLAAFGRLQRSDGDPFTADYLELIQAHQDFLRRQSLLRRRYLRSRNYAGNSRYFSKKNFGQKCKPSV